MKTIHRILCPIDFSDTSLKALAYAERLARDVGATLVLAHAFDRPETLNFAGQTRPADPELKARLDAIQPAAPDLVYERVLHAGHAGKVICWAAQERNCDLIVMGTHGHTGLLHLLLGSTAEYVLRHARCPVLTVRHHVKAEVPLEEPVVLPLPPPRFM